MSSPLRVALSGWAWRTPLGSDVDAVIDRLLRGERAAASNPRFDARSYACSLAAAISEAPAPSSKRRYLRRMGLFAIEAATEAYARYGATRPGERIGVFFGYGGLRAHWDDMMVPLHAQTPDGTGSWARGLRLFHPFWMLQHLSNNAHALLAEQLGARGEGLTLGGANAGAQALAAAAAALHAGAVDVALVAAYDTLIEPEVLVELGERGALFRADAAAPAQVPAPYDAAARGFLPGEAAAAVVLERVEDASAPLAVLAAESGADGAQGEPAPATLQTVARALCDGAAPPQVLDGAALAQPAWDAAERAALGSLCDEMAPLSACLGGLGQLGAASSVVQAVAMAAFLRRGVLPPIAGLVQTPAGPLRPLTQAETTAARVALAVSCGAPGLAGAVRVELP